MTSFGSTLPVVDAGPFFSAISNGQYSIELAMALGEQLKTACHDSGMFYIVGHNVDPDLIDRMISESAYFFACSEDEKTAISSKTSPHFRGYGLLKNTRDWREQIHLGIESCNGSTEAQYWQLVGPNLWPSRRAMEFKDTTLGFMKAVESLSRVLLELLADVLDQPSDFFTARMKNNPYLLMKSMCYLPQDVLTRKRGLDSQMGVTAHCDWSWLTFLIQDDVGGLEAQDLSGRWHKVVPRQHAFVVNTGELLEIETGGYLRASPHRVINARIDRQRYSVAVFINPQLDSEIYPLGVPSNEQSDEHVHKVIKPGTKLSTFVFGDSEWRRKGEGKWCYLEDCTTNVY